MTKYRAKPIISDGIRFASQHEHRVYQGLRLLERAKKISALSLQVPFLLHAKGGERITKYVADFTFLEDGNLVVCDAKGVKTPMYKLKRKWLLAEHGIRIREV